MSNVIVVRNVETRKELYKHELSEGEKPWEILTLLQQMKFGIPLEKIEFVMDPERETREAV